MGRLVLISLLAALAVFCVVQDRVTAAGARQYVLLQRAALAAGTSPISIDEVMNPAIERSAQQGMLWSGVTFAVGITTAAVWRRRRE